jgi:hypothetical protein
LWGGWELIYTQRFGKVGWAGLVGHLAQFGFVVRFGSTAHDKVFSFIFISTS